MFDKRQLQKLDTPPADADLLPGWVQVDQTSIINKLNYLHFQDQTVLISLKHPSYNQKILVEARPQPCGEDRFDCLWEPDIKGKSRLESYRFENFFVSDGLKLLLFQPEVLATDARRISFRLPDRWREVRSRKIRRRPCRQIQVQFIQHSTLFQGTLEEYTPISLRIRLQLTPEQSFHWINPEAQATLALTDAGQLIYSGICSILPQTIDSQQQALVVAPLNGQISRYPARKYRPLRQQLSPAPQAVIQHPLIRKKLSLPIDSLSGSGFSVQESEADSALLPGMMLDRIDLRLPGGFSIPCRGQVVSRQPLPESDQHRALVSCGVTLIDMQMEDHVKLISLIYLAIDPGWQISQDVDMDLLWDFFFATGFIYPQKYASLKDIKEDLKRTYETLYTRHPNIARHFIYQQENEILGHMAMVRACDNAWMIHHHAASKVSAKGAGLVVLRQISHYVNDAYRLASAHLHYVFCYFRPNNRFPKRIFGGVARHIGDQQRCSLDDFAYFHHSRSDEQPAPLPGGWSLSEATAEDFDELAGYYQSVSGGLLLAAFDLDAQRQQQEQLRAEYQSIGLTLERRCYALKQGELLKAFIIVNLSDIGLNLSELTNCIKLIVIDQVDLTREILSTAVAQLAEQFAKLQIPVLLYPNAFAKQQNFPVEKLYTLWILDLEALDDYFSFCERLLRRF